MAELTNKERAEIGGYLIDIWAVALRGDWGSVDGRQCRSQLNEISSFLRGGREPSLTDIGVCNQGTESAHWYGNGWDHDCGES